MFPRDHAKTALLAPILTCFPTLNQHRKPIAELATNATVARHPARKLSWIAAVRNATSIRRKSFCIAPN